MQGVDRLFIRIAVLYALVGMVLGIWMSTVRDFSMTGVHAHINLVGWASMALYALIYRTYSAAAASRLAAWHFWTANAGALLLILGIAFMIRQLTALEPVVIAGSFLTVLSMLLFAVNVFRNTGAARAPASELGAKPASVLNR